LSEQLEIKKLVVEEETHPNYHYKSFRQMVLRIFGSEKEVAANWDIEAAEQTDEEQWWSDFGHSCVEEIPRRLMFAFNITSGGCIAENSTLEVIVVLTEVPKWETLGTADCIET
jgi:hypothetical protein